MLIIGITGPAGAGKSTLAGILYDLCRQAGLPAHRDAFAWDIKLIARDAFGWDQKKDEPGRRLLQAIGTEAGRAYDPDIWIRRLDRRLRHPGPPIDITIIEDVRFTNEAEWIRSSGGSVWRVTGRAAALGASAAHASEAGIPDDHIDIEVDNSGDVAALEAQALRWLPEAWARAAVLRTWGPILDTDRLVVEVTT
jgi:hypothetical protein